jgi:hypothetical protein
VLISFYFQELVAEKTKGKHAKVHPVESTLHLCATIDTHAFQPAKKREALDDPTYFRPEEEVYAKVQLEKCWLWFLGKE